MIGTALELVGFGLFVSGVVLLAGAASGLVAAGVVLMLVGWKVGEQ